MVIHAMRGILADGVRRRAGSDAASLRAHRRGAEAGAARPAARGRIENGAATPWNRKKRTRKWQAWARHPVNAGGFGARLFRPEDVASWFPPI